MAIREEWINYVHELQDRICSSLEEIDGKAGFSEDIWQRPEGGGGRSRVIAEGDVFEKAGVNTSVVFGDVTAAMREQLKMDGSQWFACGLSLVIHPRNPFVPTVHCNYRMFELFNAEQKLLDRWFGGGADLTPYYLREEDASHFHGVYKKACDEFDPSFYQRFKVDCDNYFVNRHRNGERRGIGGIFYDYQRPSEEQDIRFWMGFSKKCGNAFLPSYIPIVKKRKDEQYGEDQRRWQEIRRGRYVEFNLVYDRGTIFGLKTNGRTESILMSLPPTARFEYNYQPAEGSAEDQLQHVCLHPREWV